MIEIYQGEQLVERLASISAYTVQSGYTVVAEEGGTATSTYVNNGGTLVASGGDVETVLLTGGDLSVPTGGMVSDVSFYFGGKATVFTGAVLTGGTIHDGSMVLDGGTATSVDIEAGILQVGNGGVADAIRLLNAQTALDVQTDGTLRNATVYGASVSVASGASVQNTVLCDYSVEYISSGKVIYYHAAMTLEAGAVHRGSLKIESGSSLVAESGSTIDFTLAGTPSGPTPLLNDFSRVFGTPSFTLTVSDNQASGAYALAGNASAFNAPLSVSCGEYAPMTLSVGGTLTYHNSVYALVVNSGTLAVDVSAYQTTASSSGLSWGDINGAESYMLELGDVQLEVATQNLDLLGLANGEYTWRVRNASEADNWQTGEAFSQTEAIEVPQKLEAVSNGAADMFFAHADGVWRSGYMAQHVGNKGDWAGTGETVELAGKARLTDIFAGSEDASILKLAFQLQDEKPLVLCGDGNIAEKGVALFLDDIYSASPVPEAQASGRLAQINTILATDGDDIIDLTSQRFEFAGGVTVHGNGGDDVIWANSGENMLLGGDGDDRIIGGSGDDVICGGTGNDTLHGGGGNDIFCFGENWGQDSVSQLSDGKVTLWFSGRQEELQLSFMAEGSNTLITAATGDSIRAVGMSLSLSDCRFGAAGYENEYDTLASSGVFV